MEFVAVQNKVLKKDSGETIDKVSYILSQRNSSKIVTEENIPLAKSQNIPLVVSGQYECKSHKEQMLFRRYTKAKCIESLAIDKYRQNGRGISFNDLLLNGLSRHKSQAQTTLKHYRRTHLLFTPYSRKPQEYYPVCLKSEILSKIIPVDPIGVGLLRMPLLQSKYTNRQYVDSNHSLDPVVLQTLEGYVLPLLPKLPLHIHRMHFKTRILSECYKEIVLPSSRWNKGKEHEEIIGSTHAKYRFYANGTVIITTESSNNPFRLADETDYSSLVAFLGQLRDRLVIFLADRHERIVPDVLSWELTQCELNKDVTVEKWLQHTGLSIQVKYLCHLFRIYIKSKGKETVCRVEESISSKDKSVVEVINDILNPSERLEKQIAELDKKVIQLIDFFGRKNSSTNELDHIECLDGDR